MSLRFVETATCVVLSLGLLKDYEEVGAESADGEEYKACPSASLRASAGGLAFGLWKHVQ